MIKTPIKFDDFLKLDIRVGKVLNAEKLSGSEKLVKLEVDLGEVYGKKNILAGIAKFYPTKDIIGKKYIFIANLKEKEMFGEVSQGMILAADLDGRPFLLPVDQSLPVGTVVR